MTNKKYQLVLGSASPRRKELLSYIHIPFDILTSDIDEISAEKDPKKWVIDVAVQKSQAIDVTDFENPFIITADTIVCLGARVFQKPEDREDAKGMLLALSGKEHSVFTAVCFKTNEKQHSFVIESKVKFSEIDPGLLELYLDGGESMDKAGAYGIQASALAFVDRLEGSYSNVVGLPLTDLIMQLKKFLGCNDDWREYFVL